MKLYHGSTLIVDAPRIINDQICFATEKALSYLRYAGFEEVS